MLKSILLFFRKSVKTKTQLILENIFLHKQLEIYQRADPKLKIKITDRIFFCLLKDLLSNWKEKIFIVKPKTVIKWHRTAFKFYWRWKTTSKEGRPRTITNNPTAEWTLQQIRNLLFEYDTPKYIIRDRDTRFGNLFSEGINQFGIIQIVTAYLSPWQNGYVERVASLLFQTSRLISFSIFNY